MKILGVDIIGLKYAVGENNSGLFNGVILLDLTDLCMVTFKRTGPDFSYNYEPGVVELHRTSIERVNKISINDLKAHVAAHILAIRDSGLEADEYSWEYNFNPDFMDGL